MAPGMGAQGAGPDEVAVLFKAAHGTVLASSSRGLLNPGPDPAALRQELGRGASCRGPGLTKTDLVNALGGGAMVSPCRNLPHSLPSSAPLHLRRQPRFAVSGPR